MKCIIALHLSKQKNTGMKKYCILMFIIIALASCSQQAKKTEPVSLEKNTSLNKVFDTYYEDRLSYFPLEATAIGDNRFNDQMHVDIADSYRVKLKLFYQTIWIR